jgi:hypothetical protein
MGNGHARTRRTTKTGKTLFGCLGIDLVSVLREGNCATRSQRTYSVLEHGVGLRGYIGVRYSYQTSASNQSTIVHCARPLGIRDRTVPA